MRGARAWWVACCLFALPAQAVITVASGPPGGFAELEAPRTGFINLSYGGEMLGSFPARYTPTSVMFDAPDAVLDAIPNLSDREGLRRVLTLPMPTNASKICRRNFGEECPRLSPADAAIIFDAQNLSAELFLNPKLLSTVDTSAPRYLPLPKRTPSSVYGFSGAIAGTTKNSPNYTLDNQATFAYGEHRLDTQTTLSDRGLRLDTADAGVERNGWEAGGGLFRSRAMQLIPDHDMAGVEAGTSVRTRLDAHKIEGNEIVIYLPRRAIVSIYREGRLITSRSYEAGNQTIDTSELPEGAYNITLHIQEQDGTTRDEQRFFAKSPDLPPPGEPTYYAQAGVLRHSAADDTAVIPKVSDSPLLRAGAIARVDSDLGLTGDSIFANDRAAAELGSFLIHGGLQLRTTGLLSTKGDSGAQMSALYNNDRWSLNADARELNAQTPKLWDDDTLFLPLQQAVAALNYNVTPDLTVGARASTSKTLGIRQDNYGPNLNWYLWREGESMLSVEADTGITNDRATADALLHFTMRFGKEGISGSGGYENGSGAVANTRIWRDARDNASEQIIGATLQHDKNTDSISADGDWRNSAGRLQGLVQQATGKGGSTTSYNGDFTTNMAQIEDDLYLGGDQSDMSAVVVELSGDNDMPMTVMVGSRAYGDVHAGQARTIYLAPYQRYDISLKPAAAGLVTYANQRRDVTLYPGNVVRLHWEVNQFYVVIAQLVDATGAPLKDASLQEDNGHTVTNENGRLQIQLTQPGRLTFITPELSACEAVLPQIKPVNGVLLYKEPLTCEPIPTL